VSLRLAARHSSLSSEDPREADGAGPDVTPLIDIVFILLIFFVVTSTFARDQGIDVERPRSTTAAAQQPGATRIAVARDGALAVNGRAVNPWRLESELRVALAGTTEQAVLVIADEQVGAGRLVEVMDAARRAGAQRIALATAEDPGARASPVGGGAVP
jgi:biopolymer transport protein ExbD